LIKNVIIDREPRAVSVTIKEIARKTGLSIPTVGNVLGRAASRYSAETRQRVLRTAQELGYRPNSSARAVRIGRFGCAALVLSRSKGQTHSYIPLGLLDGLDEELIKHDMHLTVSWLSDEELSSDEFLPKVVREYMADGLIINYTHEIPPRMLEAIHAHHAPAVWVNAKLEEDCVHPDDYDAARTATRQLIEIGHRRIAFLHLINPIFNATFEQSRPKFHYSVADRADGYVQAMRGAGLTPRVAHHDRFVAEADHLAACVELLRGEDRPTAVLVYSDHDLSSLMCAAASLGLSIPNDLSVLTFFPTEPWVGGRRVSAVQLPAAEVGRRAVRMLLQKINKPDQPCPAEAVQYQAALRETIAPPKVS
jgi:LacI family transcriptional regulator